MHYLCKMKRNYALVLKQIEEVISAETDFLANISNIAALLKTLPGYFWVGFYFVKGNDLVLGPFQGPVACTRIKHGQGVCGKAWADNRSIIVPNVNAYSGHIACNNSSESELVVPIADGNGNVFLILDVDSDSLNAFDATDLSAIEAVAKMIESLKKVPV